MARSVPGDAAQDAGVVVAAGEGIMNTYSLYLHYHYIYFISTYLPVSVPRAPLQQVDRVQDLLLGGALDQGRVVTPHLWGKVDKQKYLNTESKYLTGTCRMDTKVILD